MLVSDYIHDPHSVNYIGNFILNFSLSSLGGLSVAVPGILKGLEQAWRMFGRLPWATLIQPSIDLARNGFIVSSPIARAIQQRLSNIISGNFPELQYVICMCLKKVCCTLFNPSILTERC